MVEPMPWPPNSVLTGVASLAEDRADGVGQVPPNAGAGPGCRYACAQCPFGRFDHRDTFRRLRLAHDEADGRVCCDSVLENGQVEVRRSPSASL